MVKKVKLACVITYGCRQNESDSEKIKGSLEGLGYGFTDDTTLADVIIFNTCAVRAGAEDRVYSNVGKLKVLKKQKPHLLIGICGCMTEQSGAVDKIKKSFPYVDFVFGTNAMHRLPQIIEKSIHGRVFDTKSDENIYEGLQVKRSNVIISNVPIMYGCNNFCSYCIVPYVRGRERSRAARDITAEIEGLVSRGCKEVLLLGQNVNSYFDGENNFAALLRQINDIEGLLRIRFISSHPKDFSDELLEVMADCGRVCKQLHLPFQAGSNRVLEKMNRGYTREQYLGILSAARAKIPDITITSDVIVGFPSETQEDFENTMSLIQEARFDLLFTFIYSPREGTPASLMPALLTDEQIKMNFERLVNAQNDITLANNKQMEGRVFKVLVEGASKTDSNIMAGRTDGGKIVNFKGDAALVGSLIEVRVTKAKTFALEGEKV